MRTKQKQGRFYFAVFITFVMIFQMAFQMAAPTVALASETRPNEAPVSQLVIDINDDTNTAVVVSYKASKNNAYTSVSIPAQYRGAKVVGIGENAFMQAVYLQEVSIPDTVRSIGDMAFYQCISLKEITIPGSCSSVGLQAFMSCKSLTKVYILFGVETIGDGAFANCPNLATVAISPSTQTIEQGAFNDSDTIIQANPDSAAGQFTGMDANVSKTELPADSPSAYQYVVDEATGEVIIEGYVGTSKTPVVPDSLNGGIVTGIGDGAFEDKPITQVTLPSSLKTIGSNAFAGTNLTVVEIPSNVTGIGDGAFDDRANITLKGDSIGLDEYLKNSKYISFIPWGQQKTRYHELEIKESPALGGTILQGRSQEYKDGTQITIEAKPTTPANGGSSAKGLYRFIGWTIASKDGNITVEGAPDINTLISEPNMSKTTLTMAPYSIIVTANYELVPPNPLVIENGVVVLYTGYPNQPELAIPLTWDGQVVHTIGSYGKNNGIVFQDPLMTKLTISENITKILPSVFRNASGLKEIFVATNNQYFMSEDGVLFNKDKTKLLAYPMDKPGESYTVPSGVVEIGEYAFYGNKHLKTINFGDVKKIENNAFSYSNLTEIQITPFIEVIGKRAFYDCSRLTKVHIPSNVISLGDGVFGNCSKLGEVTWDNECQITTIPAGAFSYCAISEISLPNGAVNISSRAFASCYNLKTVHIPATITNLASDAFVSCSNLEAIHVEEGNPKYASEDGVLFNADKTVLMTYPIGKVQEGTYVVPDTVQTIDTSAFENTKLTDINLSNVTTINSRAFFASRITSIDLSNITSIGSAAFSRAPLTEVTWPEAITQVSASVFSYCSSLQKVVLPNTLVSIGNSSFYECSILDDINFPDTLTSIGDSAFSGCSKLPSVNFPEGLTTIGDHAFNYCKALQTIHVPESVKTINYAAFAHCTGLKEATIESSSIGIYAFYSCSSLEKLTFGSQVTSIGNVAFSECVKLPSVTIGASTMGNSAFHGCSALTEVILLDTVESIGNTAFFKCKNLQTVSIPASVTHIGTEAFSVCDKLESITVDANNANYADKDGVLHNKNFTTLICYPENRSAESYTTVDSVETVLTDAFESANNLKEINFTPSVTNFGYTLFEGSSKLSKIVVNNKEAVFDRMGDYPAQSFFYGLADSVLNKLVVYGYLGSTAEREVFACRIKGVKFMALDGATEGLIIQKIEKNPQQRTVDNQPLDENTWLGKVVGYKVPIEAMKTEEAKNVVVPSLVTNETTGLIIKDVDGATEITLSDGEGIIVSEIAEHAFWYPGATETENGTSEQTFVRAITSITLPQTITKIGTSAFEDCTALNAFDIPVSVEEIHPYAFQNCAALTSITIPENVIMLGADQLFDEMSENDVYTNTFYGCKNLAQINVADGNTRYASVDGVLMNHGKNKIYEAPNGFTGNVENENDHYIIPEGVSAIGSSAFLGCTLRQVDFPASMKHIGMNAFKGVLTKENSIVTFPRDDTKDLDIGNEAFKDCTGLTTMGLPPTFMVIGDGAFAGCTSLINFDVQGTNGDSRTVDGVLFFYTKSDEGVENYALFMYPPGRTDAEYVVPDKVPVRQIYDHAFQDNTALTKVVLSDTVQMIGQSSFRNCTNLSEVVWGASLGRIGDMAFENTALTNISLPISVASIGERAFFGCRLERAEIYCKNATIGQDAFKQYADTFVLYGFENSTAQDYAADNNIPFEILKDIVLQTYQITIDETIEHGSITVDTNVGHYKELITVTVTPEDGYRLVEGSLQYNGSAIGIKENTGSFEMPKADVMITAQFELMPKEEGAKVPSTISINSEEQLEEETEIKTSPEQAQPDSPSEEPSDNF